MYYDPWSVTLNPDKYDNTKTSDIRVKMTSNKGKTISFTPDDKNTRGQYFAVETGGYGVPFCVIFRPMESIAQTVEKPKTSSRTPPIEKTNNVRRFTFNDPAPLPFPAMYTDTKKAFDMPVADEAVYTVDGNGLGTAKIKAYFREETNFTYTVADPTIATVTADGSYRIQCGNDYYVGVENGVMKRQTKIVTQSSINNKSQLFILEKQ